MEQTNLIQVITGAALLITLVTLAYIAFGSALQRKKAGESQKPF